MPSDGQVAEELLDLGGAHVAQMTFVVEEDEATDAIGEALARLGLAEVGEGGLAQLVEEARRLGRGARGRRTRRQRGHGRTSLK